MRHVWVLPQQAARNGLQSLLSDHAVRGAPTDHHRLVRRHSRHHRAEESPLLGRSAVLYSSIIQLPLFIRYRHASLTGAHKFSPSIVNRVKILHRFKGHLEGNAMAATLC